VALEWAAAIRDADADTLRRLMVEDIQVIQADGRTLSGKDGVQSDLSLAFELFSIPQAIEFSETIGAVEEPGEHSGRFDGSGFASGVYVYRLRAGDHMATKKLLVIR
jgi:hypothetical protein